MYLNTFLLMFGLNPDDFVNEVIEPFQSDNGEFVYNLRQKTDVRNCPECGSVKGIINNYYYTETRFTTNDGIPIIVRIKKVRFKCCDCHCTYTPKINGIERYAKVSNTSKYLLIKEFYKQKPFSIIAKDYKMSITQVMNIFDMEFPYIQRSKLPVALCIDEIGFKTEDGKYAAILYDHDKKIVVDVIRNRQNDYLRDYFSHCSFYERNQVKFFISDLFEGYAGIRNEFFPSAIHIVDMFHVIRLLTSEISRLRIQTYKSLGDESDVRKTFMKLHWKYFECYLSNSLANKPFYSRKEHYEFTVWQMMKRCLELNSTFWDAYACLQEFYELYRYKDFTSALQFIDKIIRKLRNCQNTDLDRVANTYHKWRIEIANTIVIKRPDGFRYSNGPAEGMNNAIKTIIKDANGYKNFNRLRKRILLILNKGKDLPQ